jgi:hypothetical protein
VGHYARVFALSDKIDQEAITARVEDGVLTLTLRWTRKIGQEVKLGLLLRRTDLNDGQTEAVFGGIQGEGCS